MSIPHLSDHELYYPLNGKAKKGNLQGRLVTLKEKARERLQGNSSPATDLLRTTQAAETFFSLYDSRWVEHRQATGKSIDHLALTRAPSENPLIPAPRMNRFKELTTATAPPPRRFECAAEKKQEDIQHLLGRLDRYGVEDPLERTVTSVAQGVTDAVIGPILAIRHPSDNLLVPSCEILAKKIVYGLFHHLGDPALPNMQGHPFDRYDAIRLTTQIATSLFLSKRIARVPALFKQKETPLSLRIIQITEENKAKYRSVAKQWYADAKKFKSETNLPVMGASCDVWSGIFYDLCGSFRKWRAFAALDATKQPQGIMLVDVTSSSDFYIEWLATNPRNLMPLKSTPLSFKSSLPKKGAGSLLLKHAEEMAIQEGREFVKLDALDSAIPFYKKCGYDIYELKDLRSTAMRKEMTHPTLSLSEGLAPLTARERMAFAERLGLIDGSPKTFEQIGQIMRTSPGHAYKLVDAAQFKLDVLHGV